MSPRVRRRGLAAGSPTLTPAEEAELTFGPDPVSGSVFPSPARRLVALAEFAAIEAERRGLDWLRLRRAYRGLGWLGAVAEVERARAWRLRFPRNPQDAGERMPASDPRSRADAAVWRVRIAPADSAPSVPAPGPIEDEETMHE